MKSLFWLIASVVMSGAAGVAQTPATNRPPVAPPPAVVVPNAPRPAVAVPNAPRPVPANQDPLSTLMMTAASVDMDSPVTARAEFDPPVVAVGGRVTYRIVLTALNESVKLPDQLPAPNGLRLQPGGRAQNFQPISVSKMQPQTTINFHATATTPGAFTMPSFTLTAYNKPVPVPEARLTVVPAGAGMREAPRLFLELPEGDIFVGQSLKARVILPDPADGTTHGLSQPHITGEAILSEPIFVGQRRDIFQRNGRNLPAFVYEVIITPIREGQQTLVAQGHSITTRMTPGQPGVFQSVTSLIDSDPVTLTVKPLPKEGQLQGFTGAIGTFQLDAPKLSVNEVRAGDPLTLALTLRGEGNLGRLPPPQLPPLRDWQTFPPVSDNSPPYVIQQRGFATFNYTLIPLTDRTKATPALPFCYFDPKKRAYVDLTVPPVPVTVKPAPAGAGVQPHPSPANVFNPETDESSSREKELTLTGLAETPGRVVSSLAPLQQRPWFLALQLLPALALGGLWAGDRWRRYLESHPEVVRRRRARRGLRRQLRAARRAAATQDAPGFVAGAVNALREACAPHAAANPEALVCADVLQELPAPERQNRTGEVVRRLFAAADAIRFGGPVKDGADLLALQPELEQVLTQLRARL